MDKQSVLNILSRFQETLESQGITINQLILFGSYVAGTYREGSDIDVIVVSDDFAGKNFWERIEILSSAIYEVFEPIEAVAMTGEEWEKGESTIAAYAKEGEVIYSAAGKFD